MVITVLLEEQGQGRRERIDRRDDVGDDRQVAGHDRADARHDVVELDLPARLVDRRAQLALAGVGLHDDHVQVDEPARIGPGGDEQAAVAQGQPVAPGDAFEELRLVLERLAAAVQGRRHDVDAAPLAEQLAEQPLGAGVHLDLLEGDGEADGAGFVHLRVRRRDDLVQPSLGECGRVFGGDGHAGKVVVPAAVSQRYESLSSRGAARAASGLRSVIALRATAA